MEFTINIKIQSIFNENELRYSTSLYSDNSLRECVTNCLDEHSIDYKGCSVLFQNIDEELLKVSLVDFLNKESFDDFLDVKVKYINDIFNFNQLDISIGIGGIGGKINQENGIHYYIYSRNEHLPKHVHCISQDKKCKCILDSLQIEYKENHKHFLSNEEKRIKKYVKKNKARLASEWNRLNPNLC